MDAMEKCPNFYFLFTSKNEELAVVKVGGLSVLKRVIVA